MKYFRNKDFIEKFGKNLKKIRISKNLSQEALANECGFEISQISRIERGTQNTSISHVAEIAKALNVHPSELFIFD